MWRKEVKEGKNSMENKQQKKSSNMAIKTEMPQHVG